MGHLDIKYNTYRPTQMLPGIIAEYDADDITGVSDGGDVTTWEDNTPYGSDMAQADDNFKPTLQLDEFNGLPIVRFDGINDRIQGFHSNSYILPQPVVYAIVTKWRQAPSTSTFEILMAGRTGSENPVLYHDGGRTDEIIIWAGNGDICNTPASEDVSLWVARFDTANSNSIIRKNGYETVDTSTVGTEGSDGLTVAAEVNGSFPAPIDVAYALVADGTNWGTTEYEALESYLTTRYNITNTPFLGISGIRAHYAADQLTGLSDNDSVDSWRDFAREQTLTTPGASPTYHTDVVNGHPVVRFNGTNQYMTYGFTETISQTNTIAFVYKRSAIPGDGEDYLFDAVAGVNRQIMWVDSGEENVHAGTNVSTGHSINQNFNIMILKFDGASSTARFNGTESSTFNPGTGSFDGITLGSRHDQTGGTFFEGDVAEFLIVNDELTGSQISALESAWSTKYNISIS